MRTLPYRPLSLEWLAHRRHVITATDVPALLGYSKWGTPFSVWARLTDKPLPDREVTDEMEFGTRSEQMHADWLAELIDQPIERRNAFVQDEEFDWLCATPDAFTRPLPPAKADEGVVELKAPTRWTWDDWDAGPPLPYLLQNQAQMRVCGLRTGVVSALIPPKPRFERVEWNDDLQQQILESLLEFREKHWLTDIPPPPSERDVDRRILDAMRGANPTTVEVATLTDELAAAAREIEELKLVVDVNEAAIEERKNRLRLFAVERGAALLVSPDGDIAWSYKMRAPYLMPARQVAASPVLSPVRRKKT